MNIAFNLGLLGYFKYFNFFVESWTRAWSEMGFEMSLLSWGIILPIGISFYTFQTLGYTIDIYKGKIKPAEKLLDFSLFVAFFPQLVAGPIEKAQNLLPQLSRNRQFNFLQAKDGIHLIIWGLFKKVVIADTCAIYVNSIFTDYQHLNSLSLILGAVYFAFQIYGDFSGYSDMAVGTARLFGISLMQNFNFPYFSRNISEFWRRWHISLSLWFKEYVYIPLGGSRRTKAVTIRNIFIVFLLSGFWHGADWHFIAWGALHAFFFMLVMFVKRTPKYSYYVITNQLFPGLTQLFEIIFTFSLVCIGWIFFRAPSISIAIDYFLGISRLNNFDPEYLSIERYNVELILLILSFSVFEWYHHHDDHPFKGKFSGGKLFVVLLLLLTLGVYSDYTEFIYFQF